MPAKVCALLTVYQEKLMSQVSPEASSTGKQTPAIQCPHAGVLALVAMGQMSEADQKAVAAHVSKCGECTKTLAVLTERVAAWSKRFLYKSHLIWPNDWTWLKPYEKYLGPDGVSGLPKTRIIDRRFTLIQFSRAVRSIRGSTGECGVLGGVGSAMICKTLENSYRDGEMHFGFDSFEGLSEPAEVDRTKYAWQKKGSLAIPQEISQKNLADFPFCQLVKGWIPECFEVAKQHRFRLAHIDLDLHQPTVDSLEFFYPRMNPGGVFVLDDYGHLTCLGVRAAVNEFFSDKPEVVLETVDGVGYVFKK